MEASPVLVGDSFLPTPHAAFHAEALAAPVSVATHRRIPNPFTLLGAVLRSLLAPFFTVRRTAFYECEPSESAEVFDPQPLLHLETYDGISIIPDDIVQYIKPYPGQSLSLLFLGNKLIGYVRAAFKDTYFDEDEQYVEVSPGNVLLYSASVLPEFGGAYDAHLLKAAAHAFQKRGFGRVLAIADLALSQRINSLESAGFKRFKTVSCYRVLGKRLLRTHMAKDTSPEGA